MFDGQGVHTSAPKSGEYVPAEQSGHATVPDTIDALPGAHGTHASADDAPVSALAVPEGQSVDAPPMQNEPAGHSDWHDAGSPLRVMLPPTHGMMAHPADEAVPAGDSGADGAHARHTDAFVAPTVVL